jgi:FAD/FMN-containing dehydrogenase
MISGLSGIGESAVATDKAGRQHFWRHRDALSVAIATRGRPTKLDVAIPQALIVEFVRHVSFLTSKEEGVDLWLFGHAGDGNLHVNLTGTGSGRSKLAEDVVSMVVKIGGSISAEHGIGREKVDCMKSCRGPAELKTFRSLKEALDPSWRLNPGVLLGSGLDP